MIDVVFKEDFKVCYKNVTLRKFSISVNGEEREGGDSDTIRYNDGITIER